MGRLVSLSLVVLLAACGGEESPPTDGPDLLRDDIPDPPEGGVQIATQTFTIPPGTEQFVCMRVPFEVTRDMYVQRSNIYQMEAGHHTLVFYSESGNPGVDPEPHECGGADMTDVRIVTTGAANGTGLSMPDGVVLKLPAGADLWVQSHYINATEEPRLVQDVINLELIDESAVQQIASTFAHVDLTFSLPPLQESTRVMECTVPFEMTVPWLLPHMHELGKSFKLEILEGDTTVWEWSGDWFTGARNDFPVQELDTPLTIGPQHTIRTTCNWLNTEESTVLWPQEMCVTFFPFYPGDGSLIACDETGSVFEP